MPKVSLGLLLPGVTSDWYEVDFLLDTGATETVVGPFDAIRRLEIDPALLGTPEMWRDRRRLEGIGGSSLTYIVPARFSVAHINGDIEQWEGSIGLAQLTRHNLVLPSVLGWDVLERFDVHLSWTRREVALFTPGEPTLDARRP